MFLACVTSRCCNSSGNSKSSVLLSGQREMPGSDPLRTTKWTSEESSAQMGEERAFQSKREQLEKTATRSVSRARSQEQRVSSSYGKTQRLSVFEALDTKV